MIDLNVLKKGLSMAARPNPTPEKGLAKSIVLTGGTGLIGSAIANHPVFARDQIRPLRRTTSRDLNAASDLVWNPQTARLENGSLDGVDSIVHLAGESIVGRWTKEKKARILQSRVEGTERLAEAILKGGHLPESFISASAIGYYGSTGDRLCDETAAEGSSFLAQVAAAWERASLPLAQVGVRVVHLRIGIVLSTKGGALASMLPPFRMGLGGIVGDGSQYWSWIGLEDLVRIARFAIDTPSLRGPVNAVAPEAVTNREFTRALGQALHRPTLLPMPAFAARLALGEMADELLLTSIRVQPKALQTAGFVFQQIPLVTALPSILKSEKT